MYVLKPKQNSKIKLAATQLQQQILLFTHTPKRCAVCTIKHKIRKHVAADSKISKRESHKNRISTN